LQNQDPMKPMDNSQFLGQLAQFSTVSGIQGLQDSFSSLSASLSSSQTLQASGLIGHSVLVSGNSAAFNGSTPVAAAANLSASGDLIVDVSDASGQLVRHLDMGPQAAGLANFKWDGKDSSGNVVAAGQYSFKSSVVNGAQSTAASSFVSGNVDSISLDAGGGLTLSQVRQIT
jgi:flagellar basal-body rod modification protein FlgD